MKRKRVCIFAVGTMMAMSSACGNEESFEQEESAQEIIIQEPYDITVTTTDNKTQQDSAEYSVAGSEYEINDMLPRLSDDTLVISLEEAEALMNNRQNVTSDSAVEMSEGDPSSIVVYFSRADNIVFDPDVDAVTSASINIDDATGSPVGNMRLIAEYINEETGAVVFPIWTADSYPTAYRDTTDLAAEEKKANARPELVSPHIDNMDDYDVIYLCYPNWWGTLPMPVASFLEEYDFSGKTIVPFASHEGSGLGSGVSMIKELCPDAEVLDGFAVRGSEVNTNETKEKVAEFIADL